MEKTQEKVVSAQTIAHDLIAQVSAMINQNDISKESVVKLKGRILEMSEMLDSIDTEQLDF